VQRDLLRELAQLVRYVEPDGTNIGPFVTVHAGELAHLLQSDDRELRAAEYERDGALVDRLRARLEVATEREHQLRNEQEAERSRQAARELAQRARWFELGVVLDVDVVLGDLLADSQVRLISFVLDDATVTLRTAILRRARLLLREYMDLACFVDERGVHFRWKAGRGQLNFYRVERASDDAVLAVHLPKRAARGPVPIGDVLADVGVGR
jgi:hypothetical protein